MKMDSDPMQIEDAHYAEPMEILMVEFVEGSNMDVDKGEQIFDITDTGIQAVYPQSEEWLIDFLEHYMLNDSKKMMSPYCSVVFDEEVAKKLDGTRRFDPRRGRGGSQATRFTPNNGGRPCRNEEHKRKFQHPRQRTFQPPASTPKEKWVNPLNQKRENHPKWKEVDPKVGIPNHNGQKVSKGKSHVPLTYKGNNPMTCIQCRRHQRKKG